MDRLEGYFQGWGGKSRLEPLQIVLEKARFLIPHIRIAHVELLGQIVYLNFSYGVVSDEIFRLRYLVGRYLPNFLATYTRRGHRQ
jgi:hypothetical protein